MAHLTIAKMFLTLALCSFTLAKDHSDKLADKMHHQSRTVVTLGQSACELTPSETGLALGANPDIKESVKVKDTAPAFGVKITLNNTGNRNATVKMQFYASEDMTFGDNDRKNGFLREQPDVVLPPGKSKAYWITFDNGTWVGKRYIIAAWKSNCQDDYEWAVLGRVEITKNECKLKNDFFVSGVARPGGPVVDELELDYDNGELAFDTVLGLKNYGDKELNAVVRFLAVNKWSTKKNSTMIYGTAEGTIFKRNKTQEIKFRADAVWLADAVEGGRDIVAEWACNCSGDDCLDYDWERDEIGAVNRWFP